MSKAISLTWEQEERAKLDQARQTWEQEERAKLEQARQTWEQERRAKLDQELANLTKQLEEEAKAQLARTQAETLWRTLRDNLRSLLDERFGPLPADLVQRIEATGDPERLRACLRQVVQITELREFQI